MAAGGVSGPEMLGAVTRSHGDYRRRNSLSQDALVEALVFVSQPSGVCI